MLDYEGKRSVDIRKERPDWNVFRDGCPHGEMPAQILARADRFLARLRTLSGKVALFSHGQFGGALAVRWIGLPLTATVDGSATFPPRHGVAQHFRLQPPPPGSARHRFVEWCLSGHIQPRIG